MAAFENDQGWSKAKVTDYLREHYAYELFRSQKETLELTLPSQPCQFSGFWPRSVEPTWLRHLLHAPPDPVPLFCDAVWTRKLLLSGCEKK